MTKPKWRNDDLYREFLFQLANYASGYYWSVEYNFDEQRCWTGIFYANAPPPGEVYDDYRFDKDGKLINPEEKAR